MEKPLRWAIALYGGSPASSRARRSSMASPAYGACGSMGFSRRGMVAHLLTVRGGAAGARRRRGGHGPDRQEDWPSSRATAPIASTAATAAWTS